MLILGHLAAIALGPSYCSMLTAATWMGSLLAGPPCWRRPLMALAVGTILPGMAVVQGSHARLQGMHVDLWVSARIVRAEPAVRPRLLELDVLSLAGLDGSEIAARPRRVRLQRFAPDDPLAQARIGEVWELPLRLRAPRGLANPGTGDPERNLFRGRIDAQGYVRGEGGQRLAAASSRPRLAEIRQRASEAIARETHGAGGRHLQGLLVGDRSALHPGDWQLLARTGTTHLLVVSGLHVGMVAAVAWGLAVMAGLRGRRPGLATAVMLAAAAAYAFLTGFELPAQRALLMLGVAAMLTQGQRHGQPFAGLAWAALAVLLWDPLAPLSAGFWLSFLAVAALLLIIGGRSVGGLSRLRGTVLAQLAVTTLLLLPLTLTFGRVPLQAPLINLFAIPLVAMGLLPLGLLLGLALWLGVPGAGMGLGVLAEVLSLALAALASLPELSWPLRLAQPWLLPLALLAAVGVWQPWPWPMRALSGGLLLSLLLPAQSRIPAGEVRIDVFEVGQGHAALLRTRHHAMLFDTGPGFGGAGMDAGSRVLLPALGALGVRHLDRIMVSHAHLDHMGGLASVRAAFPDAVVSNATPLPDARLCHAGQGWRWDGVAFDVLAPPPGVAGEPRWFNRHSCVLRIRSASARALLPGDIDVFTERQLVGQIGAKDFLVAPHHGSHTSSGRVLVRTTRPRFVVVPAGCPSPFGHPHDVVVERWLAVGAVLEGTGTGGMLSWQSWQPERLERFRDGRQRYWNWPTRAGCQPLDQALAG